MLCEGCGKCQGIKLNNQVYTVTCLEKGEFSIHSDNVSHFNCYERAEPIEETPPRDNVLIILKSGRDMVMYDKDITCMADLDRMIIEDALEWPEFGNFTFKRDEIACYGYIGG